MIKIKIYGTQSDTALKDTLYDFSCFYLRELMPRVRKIRIKIDCIKNLIKKEGIYGDCILGQDDQTNYDYIIRLNKDSSRYDMLTTLSHEFVHLKQFHKRYLRMGYKHNTWHGKKYTIDYDYDNCPWEKEATNLELKLYEKCLENLTEYK